MKRKKAGINPMTLSKSDKNAEKPGFELDRLDLSHISEALDAEAPPGRWPVDSEGLILESIIKSIGEIDSFLSFSRQLEEINNILKMEYASTREIADVLLKDFALTSKLLKLANSPFYMQFSNKGITTISEAMIILGTDQIQQTAANLLFFEFMQGLSKNRALMKKTLTSFMRGIIARETASSAGLERHEEFQICAMLHDFGEYILLFLYPGKHREVEICMDRYGIDKEEASRKILGMSYSRIGRLISLKWGIPDKIVRTMKPVPYIPKTLDPVSDTDMKRYVSTFSQELCSRGLDVDTVHQSQTLDEIVEQYRGLLNLTNAKAEQILEFARNSVIQHASILGIDMDDSWFAA